LGRGTPAEGDLGRVIGDGATIPDGEVDGLGSDELLQLYRNLVLLRTYDERSVIYHRQGRIGTYAIFWNHEAMQAGSAYALEDDDWIFPSYRESAIGLLRGMPARVVLQWWRGHPSGWWNPADYNVASICVPIGTHVPHAAGPAWGKKLPGRRACAGEDGSDLLVAVLSRDVDFAALPKDTPPALERLMRRCLERDVKLRLRDIGEARVLLSNPQTMSGSAVAASSGVPTKRWTRAHVIVAALALMAVGAAGGAVAWWFKPAPVEREARFEIAMPDGASDQFALAPDGEIGVYQAAARLWLRRFDAVKPHAIPGTDAGAVSFRYPVYAIVA